MAWTTADAGSVERLSKDALAVLLDMLDRHRGDFLKANIGCALDGFFDVLLGNVHAPRYRFEDDGMVDIPEDMWDSPLLWNSFAVTA